MKPRRLEEQFEPESTEQIRKLQGIFEALPLQGHPARYFAVEINRCLEAGLLLAALQLALTLLELLVRERLITAEFEERSLEYQGHPVKLHLEVRKEIEDILKLGFKPILERLSRRGLVDDSDADAILHLYEEVRNPIQHAIIGRLLKQFSWFGPLGDVLPMPIMLTDFDEMIELTALTFLDATARFLDKYACALHVD